MTYQLTESDLREVERITSEIMKGLEHDGSNRMEFADHVREVLSKNLIIAQDEYDARLREEETHRWEFGHHSIAECQVDWCGRYRGQRR